MNPKFSAMLAKKRQMKPSEKHAKMGVLNDLKGALADDMGDKLHGMKKVSVMSNSPQGLSAGLDRAKQLAQGPEMDQDGMHMGGKMHGYSEGGLAENGHLNPDESYHGFGPMDENAKSKDMDPDEPEHVSYDGSPDTKMGPGYFKGGEVGPNEADVSDVTYSGHGEDYGAEHSDSDEDDDVKYSGNDFGKRDHNSDEFNTGFSDGGEVESPLEEATESADEERKETEGDMGDEEEAHPEFKGLDIHEVEEKLQHLMRMKKQMEKQ